MKVTPYVLTGSSLSAYELTIWDQSSSEPSSTTQPSSSETVPASSRPSTTTGGSDGPLPLPTATPTPMRQMKAWRTGNATFIVWQVPNGDLYLQGYYPLLQSWSSPLRLDLTYSAIDNTPLALFFYDYGDVFVRLQFPLSSKSHSLTVSNRSSDYSIHLKTTTPSAEPASSASPTAPAATYTATTPPTKSRPSVLVEATPSSVLVKAICVATP
jgi:hypothetical protein